MKIVFVIDQVHTHGGIERVLSIKANHLVLNPENEVFIITSEQKGIPSCYEFNNKITFIDLGVNYQRDISYFHPKNLRKLPKHIFAIRSQIKNIKPDVLVVCSHSTDTYFMPFVCKKVPKIKEFHYSKHIEVAARTKPKNKYKKYFFKFADYVESKYDKLVVLNKDEKAYYKSDNTIVIGNPLTFYPDTTAPLDSKVAIAVGRIAPVKGYDTLIDIWNLFQAKKNNWKLHIYGTGDIGYMKMLQDKIDGYGLQESLVLKGSSNTIQDEMLHAAVFLMTSHNECFPLVLLEAQACGLPIVSFDCPNGPRNIINDKKDGSLIPLYDNEEFANHLNELLANTEYLKTMGVYARKNAVKYEVNTIMNQWMDMFRNVIQVKDRK